LKQKTFFVNDFLFLPGWFISIAKSLLKNLKAFIDQHKSLKFLRHAGLDPASSSVKTL